MSELKAINAHGVRKDDGSYYDRRQVDKYIDELDERHTTEITALEVSYKLQLDGLRYYKDAEIRRLKRALWLARDERANEIHFMWCQLIYDKKYGIVKFNVRKECYENIKQGQTLHTPQGWADVWDEVEYRCRAKAEEYK